jgi:hypothetical protein
MAKTRMITTDFRSDTWIDSLDPLEKLLYIYCFTNDKTSWCGATEIPLKKIWYETWIDRDMVSKILWRFESEWKVIYYNWYLIVKNFIRRHFNWFDSPDKWSKNNQLKSIEYAILQLSDDVYTKCYGFITGFSDVCNQEWKGLCRGLQGISKGIVPSPLPLSSPLPLPSKKSTTFVPPILDDVEQYFQEKWYTEYGAKKAFDYYDVAWWKDSNGKQIKNWKQKMISVWFKPEYEIKKTDQKTKTKSLPQDIYSLYQS